VEVIGNGGFETGDFEHWITSGTPAIDPIAHHGHYAAALGSEPNADDQLAQIVLIPSTATVAYLTFWWDVSTDEPGGRTPPDRMVIEARGEGDSVLARLGQLSNAHGAGTWRQTSVDLLEYSGLVSEPFRLVFHATTDGEHRTVFRIDDVSVRYTELSCAEELVLEEPFEWGELPPGWMNIDNTGNDRLWRFEDLVGRGNETGGCCGFATMDGELYGGQVPLDAELVTPPLDLSRAVRARMEFDTRLVGELGQVVDVDLSPNRGATWRNLWQRRANEAEGPGRIALDLWADGVGHDHVLVRFRYQSLYTVGWWQVDGLQVAACVATRRGVAVSPATDSRTTVPGTAATYSVSVENTGNSLDTFDLAVGGNSWPTTGAPTTIALPARSSAEAVVEVRVPLTAATGDQDTAIVSVVSRGDASAHASARLTTRAAHRYGVAVAADAPARSGPRGRDVVYEITVSNTGTTTDAFALTTSTGAWSRHLSPTGLTVGPGGAERARLAVRVPDTALAGAEDVVRVTAASPTSGATAALDLTTRALPDYAVRLSPAVHARAVDPGQVAPYDVRVDNLGNASDTFDIVLLSDWPATVSSGVVAVAPLGAVTITASIAVPASALADEVSVARIRATSRGGGAGVSDVVEVATTARARHGLVMTADADWLSVDPGSAARFTIAVTNTGNVVSEPEIVVTSGTWAAAPTRQLLHLPAGANASFGVDVEVPPSALAGERAAVGVALMERGENVASPLRFLVIANRVLGLAVRPREMRSSALPSSLASYTLALENTGNHTETLVLDVTGTWTAAAAPAVVDVPPRADSQAVVSVFVPPGARSGSVDETTVAVSVSAAGGAGPSDASTLITTAATYYGLDLEPRSGAAGVDPPGTAGYTFVITNTGNAPDDFDVLCNAESPGGRWIPACPRVVPPAGNRLEPGQSSAFTAQVVVPADVPGGYTDAANVRVSSRQSPAGSPAITARVLTTANRVYRLSMAPSSTARMGLPGEVVTHTLRVTNDGNTTDTFVAGLTDHRWRAGLALSPRFEVPQGGSADVHVRVYIPSQARSGEADGATLTVAARAGQGPSAVATLGTTVRRTHAFVLHPRELEEYGAIGGSVPYPLWVINEGNAPEEYDISVSGRFPASFPATVGPVAAGDGKQFLVTVSVPASAGKGDVDRADVTVWARSASEPKPSDTALLTTTAHDGVGVVLSPQHIDEVSAPGRTLTFDLRVLNFGVASDTYTVTVRNPYNDWLVRLSAGNVTTPPAGPARISVTVPPWGAGPLRVTLVPDPGGRTEGRTSTFELVATSGRDPTCAVLCTSRATIAVTEKTVRQLAVSPAPSRLAGERGSVVVHRPVVTNRGNVTEALDVELLSNRWPAAGAAYGRGALGPGESRTVPISVTVPAAARDGDADTATLRAFVLNYGSVSATAELVTQATVFAVKATDPGPGNHAAGDRPQVVLHFNRAFDRGTVGPATLRVHGSLTGYVRGTFGLHPDATVPRAAFTPSVTLAPGELLEVSATSGIRSGSLELVPRVWRFQTATGTGSNRGSGNYAASQTLGPSDRVFQSAIALGDLDGDGDLDILLSPGVRAANEAWLNLGGAQGGSAGQFSPRPVLAGTRHSRFRLADVDGDGDLDVLAQEGRLTELWLNDGSASFTNAGRYFPDCGAGAAVGDIDLDGSLDILCGRLYLNTGQGVFLNGSGTFDGHVFALGDVDNDRDLDAFVMGEHIRVYRNGPIGTLRYDNAAIVGSDSWQQAELVDLDNDGDLDAVALGRNSVYWWLNRGGRQRGVLGQFDVPMQMKACEQRCDAMALGDVDGDGDLDIVVSSNLERIDNSDVQTKVLVNQGGAQAGALGTFADGGARLGRGSGVAVGDVDGDGDLDIVLGPAGWHDGKVLRNTARPATTSPANGSAGVSLDRPVGIDFDVPVLRASLALAFSPHLGGLSTRWSAGHDLLQNETGTTVVVDHAAFRPSTTYHVTVSSARDAAGVTLPGVPYTWRFRTVSGPVYLPVLACRAAVSGD